MSITLRAAQPDDDNFLHELYAATRADEMAAWGWDAAQQQAFLHLQFLARQSHYNQYPNADHRIILSDGRPIGRLFISRLEEGLHLVDIALLPENRGAGIGAALINGLLDEAARAGKPVRLHVEKSNRAQRLYQRLGFVAVADLGIYLQMEWRAPHGERRQPIMLDTLHYPDFAGQLNSIFHLPDHAFDLELIEAEDRSPSPRQEQFSLLFRAPQEAPPRQGMYRLEHACLGAGEIFLAPLRRDRDGMYYEAVFNRSVATKTAQEAAAQ